VTAKPPIIRPISWIAVVVQLAIICVFAFLVRFLFGVRELALAFLLGAIAHSVIYRLMRLLLTREHRRGIMLFRARKFAEAAPEFEASYAALRRRPWIDRFRLLLLGSGGSMSYREMALCNAAFAYAQVADGSRAIKLYEQALREFPESGLAASSLQMLRAGQTVSPPKT
jgi:tetratricopeptide (TPR) repeat protein